MLAGVSGFGNYLVQRVCCLCLLSWLGAPGLGGLCRQQRKQPLPWLSCHSREPFLKLLLQTPSFELSISLSYSDPLSRLLSRFGHTLRGIYPPHSFGSFFSLLNPRKLVAFRNSVPTSGVFLTTSGNFSSVGVMVHWVCEFLSVGFLIYWWVRVSSWEDHFEVWEGRKIFCLPIWSLWSLDQSRIRFRAMGIMWGEIS